LTTLSLPSPTQYGIPQGQVGLDVDGEADVAALGCIVFGGVDLAQEMACLGDHETTVIEPSNQGVDANQERRRRHVLTTQQRIIFSLDGVALARNLEMDRTRRVPWGPPHYVVGPGGVG
jgi:hypothetical protein